MKKLAAALLPVALLGLMTLSIAPAAWATAPTSGSGTLTPISFTVTNFYTKDGNAFVTATEVDDLSGPLLGTWTTTDEKIVFHPNGLLNFQETDHFVGTVAGRSGTLDVQFVGTGNAATTFEGQFAILSGTGDLANLNGQGTMLGDSTTGAATYMIQYHFG